MSEDTLTTVLQPAMPVTFIHLERVEGPGIWETVIKGPQLWEQANHQLRAQRSTKPWYSPVRGFLDAEEFAVTLFWKDRETYSFRSCLRLGTEVNLLRCARESAGFDCGAWRPAHMSEAGYQEYLTDLSQRDWEFARLIYDRLPPTAV